MSSMLLGERITNLMELQNTSKKQVCESLHIHPSTFSGYLSANVSQVTIFLCVWQPISTRPATICSVTSPPQNSMPDLSDDAVAILQACGNLSPEGQDILKDEIKLILHHYQKQPK